MPDEAPIPPTDYLPASATDPVCGMTVDPAMDKPSHVHDGTIFHFCSQGCHDKFAADPMHYLSGAHRNVAEDAPTGTMFTCPMDPEIIQEGPGTPIGSSAMPQIGQLPCPTWTISGCMGQVYWASAGASAAAFRCAPLR